MQVTKTEFKKWTQPQKPLRKTNDGSITQKNLARNLGVHFLSLTFRYAITEASTCSCKALKSFCKKTFNSHKTYKMTFTVNYDNFDSSLVYGCVLSLSSSVTSSLPLSSGVDLLSLKSVNSFRVSHITFTHPPPVLPARVSDISTHNFVSRV